MNLSAIGWPQGALGSGYPDAPKNLLPGRIEGWPQGTQSSANEAERLLSTAVAWWDADHYEDGDKILRNRGIAGDLLDLQLGSNPRVPTTNDPLYLAPEETGYVYLPGVSGNYLSVPDEAALDITGDIDIRVQVASDNWDRVTDQALASKRNAGGYSYLFTLVSSTGQLRLFWTADGSTVVDSISSVAVPFSDGATHWVRVTLDVDNGASGNDVKFYTSNNGSTWSQLGTTQTAAGTTSIYSSTAPVWIGYRYIGSPFLGSFHRAIIKDGIDGTTVLDVDCDAITDSSQTSFQAKTGQTVTINRSTSGRKSVAMPNKYPQKTDNGWSRGKPLFLFGSDDYMQVMNEWQHQLLNFDAGDSISVLFVFRRWSNFSDNWHIIGKSRLTTGNSQNTNLGWRWRTRTDANASTFYISDGISGDTDFGVSGISSVSGELSAAVAKVSSISINSNNTISMQVGTIPTIATPYYADMEFTAAAVFRRALTPEEIATITNYYTTTAPGFQGEPEITAIDLLESSVFWIDPNISEIV